MERVAGCWAATVAVVTRTKSVDVDRLHDTSLRRCLSVFDLTALGVGSTLGAGIYILIGQVARTQTGPAILFSFCIAAFASFLAGICYAEFASRVPRAGSAYVYSYVSVGELWAFVIGWNMILENMIGAASSGKAWSQYLDSMINDTIRRSLESSVGNMSGGLPGIDTYPDLLAMSLLLLATALVSVGVKMSSSINLVFTIINLAVTLCVIVVGAFYADSNNWTHSPGGFFPFHFKGVIAGAATCFYAFIGFDTIAASGEESTQPTKHIPQAIVATLIISLAAYLGVSIILTMLVPWNQLADTAALAKAFSQVGVPGAEYVIAVGALCSLTSCMMGSIFPLPRAVYAMAQDGLLFSCLGSINNYTGTPLVATVVFGLLVAVCALVFDLDALIQTMSIGTLMAYALVSVCVLVLHYQHEQVGLTAADHMTSDLVTGGITGSSQTTSTDTLTAGSSGGAGGAGIAGTPGATRLSVSEDTGLLRVGDALSRVRYVPANTTPTQPATNMAAATDTNTDANTTVTVIKRLKPHTDDDDDDDQSRSAHPAAAPPPVPPPAPPITEPSVVEMYRAKMAAERAADAQRHLSNGAQQSSSDVSNYARLQDSSIDNLSQLFNAADDYTDQPTWRTRRVVIVCLLVISTVWTLLCVLFVYCSNALTSAAWWAVTLVTLGGLVIVGLMVLLARQPRNSTPLHFKTPLVPWLPLASVLINIYLMVTLSTATWIRFGIWMTIGTLVYVLYGVWHSVERRPTGTTSNNSNNDAEVILYNVTDKDSLVVDAVYR